MKSVSEVARSALGICVTVTVLDACSGAPLSALLPSAQTPTNAVRGREHTKTAAATGYVYVTNRTQSGASQLLVYRAGSQNPAPVRIIMQGLVDVASVAVDSSGDIYVANGSGRNVLEYSPGGASLVQTYSVDLVHPVGATVAKNTLYVADQGDAANGYLQQVLEYTIGNGKPLIGISGIGGPSQLNEGIAVDPLGTLGTFFASASSLTGIPPTGCPGTFTVAQNVLPTLWNIVPLSNNQQAWGLAFDSKGKLFVADPCKNDVAIYSEVDYAWTYAGRVPGTFSSPLFLTINNDMLAVPSGGGAADSRPGYVTLIDLSNNSSTITITKGLEHPVGAAVAQ